MALYKSWLTNTLGTMPLGTTLYMSVLLHLQQETIKPNVGRELQTNNSIVSYTWVNMNSLLRNFAMLGCPHRSQTRRSYSGCNPVLKCLCIVCRKCRCIWVHKYKLQSNI